MYAQKPSLCTMAFVFMLLVSAMYFCGNFVLSLLGGPPCCCEGNNTAAGILYRGAPAAEYSHATTMHSHPLSSLDYKHILIIERPGSSPRALAMHTKAA
jgi:hypothetical protein